MGGASVECGKYQAHGDDDGGLELLVDQSRVASEDLGFGMLGLQRERRLKRGRLVPKGRTAHIQEIGIQSRVGRELNGEAYAPVDRVADVVGGARRVGHQEGREDGL
jgi:hypothetical protein